MKASFHFEGNKEKVVKDLRDLADQLEAGSEEKSHHDVSAIKKGKKGKDDEDNGSEDPAAEEGSDDADLGGEEADDLDLGEAEEEEPEAEEEKPAKKAPVAAKGPTLEGDVIPAFKAFVKKHSKEKAKKILAKYKVSNVRELPAKVYPEVLKLLRVA